MRLIDADALKNYFFRAYSNEEAYSNIDIERIIDKQPTIKPERKTCEGCKHEYDNPCSVRPFCARMHDDLYLARDNK